MHFYSIEPDQHQRPTPYYYWGNYVSVEAFLIGRENMSYMGNTGKEEVVHDMTSGCTEIIVGVKEPMYFDDAKTALDQAYRFQDQEKQADIYYWDGDKRCVFLVRAYGIMSKEAQHV